MKKRTVERADEISYLLFQVKNSTGRVRDSHHPLQAYPSHKYWRKRMDEKTDEKTDEKRRKYVDSEEWRLWTDRQGRLVWVGKDAEGEEEEEEEVWLEAEVREKVTVAKALHGQRFPMPLISFIDISYSVSFVGLKNQTK